MAEGVLKEGKKKWMDEGGVIIAMLMVQFINTGLQLLSKVVLSQGTFVFAYVFYRSVVGAFCALPFALLFERGKGVGSIKSWRIFFWLNVVALTGVTMALGLFSYGLKDTTATYATNFLNLIPIVTFFLSTLLRFEKLGLRTTHGKMKIIGAILCLGGALVTIFYRGKIIYIDMGHITHHYHSSKAHHSGHIVDQAHWTRGTIFLSSSCLSLGLWFISQAKLATMYPYKFWSTFYTLIIAAVHLLVIGLCINRSHIAWWLKWDLQLVAICYSGALGTGATFWLISLGVIKRGPTYPSMFNPLSLVFVAILEGFILEVPTSVGSLVGMFVVIIGIYSYLWGKAREIKVNTMELMKTIAVVVPVTAPVPELALAEV